MGYRVAVVGATGNVGREMLQTLAERGFPADEVAAQGLLAAAAVACDVLQDLSQARQLYKTCLKLAKPHSPMIRIVEEKLAAMDTPG